MKSVFLRSEEFKTGEFDEDIVCKRKALKGFLAVSVVLFACFVFDSVKAGGPFPVLLSSGGLLASLSGLFFAFREYEFSKAVIVFRIIALSCAILIFFLHLHIFVFKARFEFVGWTLVVPMFFFFLLGLKEGAVAGTVYLLLVAYVFFSGGLRVPVAVDGLTKQTFFALATAVFLSCWYERVRVSIKSNYFQSKSELGEAKQRLESKNTELQKTVFDLNGTKKKLEDLNSDLEIMVAKRTVELSEQNNRLLKEIRERERVEKRLQESEAKYRQIVENVPVAILEFDLMRNHFTSINREVSRVLGFSEDELLKMGPFDLLHEECKETVKNRLKAAVAENEEPLPFEYRVRTKDNKTVWVYGGTKLFYEDGELARTLTVAQNVTDRKVLEQQFLQVQKQEALGTLAAGVAHNFNNLMMGIQGNAAIACHMLQEENPARKYLANIEKIVDEASLLAERFLNFARGGKHQSRVTDVKELVLKTAAVFRGARKDVRLFTFFEDDLRTVEVDPGQIEQVLLDVLVNSWQAMPKGGDVFLDVRMFDTQARSGDSKLPDQMPEGKYVRICIADEGLGMDKATTERIFDPFFSTKTDTKGIGLGLASAYGIVKNHRGHILVSSEPGRGSVFEIYLPASAKKAVARDSQQKRLRLGSHVKVLVVDDENSVRKAVQRMLEALGSSVTAVESGIDAIELLSNENSRFDLVILDMIMPEMSGVKTYAKIRKSIRP